MRNETKLFWVKSIHTLVWAILAGAIFFVLITAVSDNVNTYTWISIGVIFGEGLILMIFNRTCPLTLVARKYSDSKKENFDIYLPNWLAKYNKRIFTAIFLVGFFLTIYRSLN